MFVAKADPKVKSHIVYRLVTAKVKTRKEFLFNVAEQS